MKILIAGGGQTAALVARRLIREGNDVTLIENNIERCEQLEELLDAKIIHGNATSIGLLRAANIQNVDMLIALTSDDQVNVLLCLIASVEFAVKVKMARLRSHEFEHWQRVLRKTGLKIDLLIHPETEIANRVLRVVRLPGVSDIIDFAEGRVKLFGMNINESNWMANKTVEELDSLVPSKNFLIAMIFRGQQVIIPHGGEVLRPGDHVYTVTSAKEVESVYQFMGLETQEFLDRVFILGGKQVGILIAEMLERQGIAVKLFERDLDRCNKISQILKKSVVIHADGTDEIILAEENIQNVGAFLAMTNHDEDNIMASLLARKLGAKKVVALINRLNYLPMVQRLGINTTVSPRLVAVDRILRFIRKGRVLSVTTFREEEAEAIELIAGEGSKYIGRNLSEVRFPNGAIVGAIVRSNGEVIMPRGKALIQPGDRVIFFALETTIPLLESAFLVESPRTWL